MALAKFSKFKKERRGIKEARNKELKVQKFNKIFAEKLKEMGLSSVGDLKEDQINAFLESLKKQDPVNEDRAKEIEAHVVAAGEPQELGAEGSESEAERAKKHTFTSPQDPTEQDDADAKTGDAEELKADAPQLEEAKKSVKEDEEADGEEDEKKGDELEDKGDVKVDSEDDEEKADHYAGAVKSDDKEIAALKKDKDFDKEEEEDAKADESIKEAKINEGGDIKSDEEFKKYAEEVLKKAHPDDFDEKVAKKVVDGLLKKYGDDYGAAVGALTSGFGG